MKIENYQEPSIEQWECQHHWSHWFFDLMISPGRTLKGKFCKKCNVFKYRLPNKRDRKSLRKMPFKAI